MPDGEMAVLRQRLDDHVREDELLHEEMRDVPAQIGAIHGRLDTLAGNNAELMQAVFTGKDGKKSLVEQVGIVRDRVESGTAFWRWAIIALLTAIAAFSSAYAALKAGGVIG